MYDRRLLRSDVADLRALADLTAQGGLRTQSWQHIDRMLSFVANYTWVVRALSRGEWVRYTEGSADTIVRYFNEAVDFIITGKRTISIQGWDAIVRDSIARDFKNIGPSATRGNIGTMILTATGSVPKQTLQRSGNDQIINRALLDFVEKEIILMWSMRPNGLEDMVLTLARLAEILYALQEENGAD